MLLPLSAYVPQLRSVGNERSATFGSTGVTENFLVDPAGRLGSASGQPNPRAQMRRPLEDELGIRASLHRTEVSQLERGLRVARIDTLVKLAACLSVSADELLAGIAWVPGHAVSGGFTVSEQSEDDDAE